MTNVALREVEEQLKKVVIHLTWNDGFSNKLKHGTAFFVGANGVALTAFHNIEETLAVNPSGWLAGQWQGKNLRFRWKLPGEEHAGWQREHDIAVLQSEEPPLGLATVTAGYLDATLSEGRRSAHWAGSRVLLAGFARAHEYELASGDGHMHQNPLGTVQVEGKRYQVLKFGSFLVTNGIDDGPGLSGSPVYCPADRSIIGMTIAARTELSATELWPIHKNWDESGAFLTRLKPRPEQMVPGPVRDRRGAMIRAAVAVCFLLASLAGWMLWRQTRHTIPNQLTANVTRLDAGRTEPVSDGMRFRMGERVRFQFTSPKDGHLYIVDQEIVGGKLQEPFIIFPTLRTGEGRNNVKAGDLVDFPGEKDDPPYLKAAASEETGYEGELLTLLVFPSALPVALKETPIPLEPALFSLDGLRPRLFVHPLAPPADAVAIRHIRLRVTN